MSLTLLVGFAAIGGILAGYVTARLAPRRALWWLWGASILAPVLFYLWSKVAVVLDPFAFVFILVGGLIPFAACAIVAGLIGLVIRRTIGRDP